MVERLILRTLDAERLLIQVEPRASNVERGKIQRGSGEENDAKGFKTR